MLKSARARTRGSECNWRIAIVNDRKVPRANHRHADYSWRAIMLQWNLRGVAAGSLRVSGSYDASTIGHGSSLKRKSISMAFSAIISNMFLSTCGHAR